MLLLFMEILSAIAQALEEGGKGQRGVWKCGGRLGVAVMLRHLVTLISPVKIPILYTLILVLCTSIAKSELSWAGHGGLNFSMAGAWAWAWDRE